MIELSEDRKMLRIVRDQLSDVLRMDKDTVESVFKIMKQINLYLSSSK